MSTRYRKDVVYEEFCILARFSRALEIVVNPDGGKVVWLLGEQELWLPTWYEAVKGWRISSYRMFRLDAIAIKPCDFKRICKYLQILEPALVSLLFKSGILAVTPELKPLDRPAFRQEFTGVHIDNEYMNIREASVGYIFVRNRAEGNWKLEAADEFSS